MSNIAVSKPLPLVGGQISWVPMWTTDGQRLVLIVSGRDRTDAVYWRRPDGTDDAEHLIDTRSGEGWKIPLPRSRASDVPPGIERPGHGGDRRAYSLPIKGFAQAEYRRQFDLTPEGRQFLMLFPIAK